MCCSIKYAQLVVIRRKKLHEQQQNRDTCRMDYIINRLGCRRGGVNAVVYPTGHKKQTRVRATPGAVASENLAQCALKCNVYWLNVH